MVNATGVILHTNLGRAPLAAAARAAVARRRRATRTSSSIATGARGSRHAHVEELLCELTGAEAGFAVNNGAGAALLAAAALAGPGRSVDRLARPAGRDRRRLPRARVIAQAGARLVEVGTTNRTRLSDYVNALGPDTGAVLRVHQSNFRQLGFVEDVADRGAVQLGVPVIDDVGSGALDSLFDEPPVRRSVARGRGARVLLGRQAARRAAGRAARRAAPSAVAAARRHPLARALRIDKLSLAALEATLRLHRDAPSEIPVLAMLDATPEELARRAQFLASRIEGATVIDGDRPRRRRSPPAARAPGPGRRAPDDSPALRRRPARRVEARSARLGRDSSRSPPRCSTRARSPATRTLAGAGRRDPPLVAPSRCVATQAVAAARS